MDTVLIVGAEAELLTRVVRSSGMTAVCVKTAEAALASLAEHSYALILLGGLQTKTDTFTAVEAIRRQGIRTPLIVIGEQAEEFDILYALDIGADDYVTKPFSPAILGAKLRAMLRRIRNRLPGDEPMLTAGPFTYSTSTLRLYKHGTEIPLSSKENAMMKLFLDNVNRIFSKEMLYDLVWGEAMVDENAIMVYISRLRQKIEDDPAKPRYLQNVRGLGYRFTV